MTADQVEKLKAAYRAIRSIQQTTEEEGHLDTSAALVVFSYVANNINQVLFLEDQT